MDKPDKTIEVPLTEAQLLSFVRGRIDRLAAAVQFRVPVGIRAGSKPGEFVVTLADREEETPEP